MSNDVTGIRWVFNGVSTAGEKALLNKSHRIIGLFWVEGEGATNDIAANDVLEIVDAAGKIIYTEVAAGTPATASNAIRIAIADPGLPVLGFNVKQLGGGSLIVWLRPDH
jgi:hypothetical protein